MTADVIDFAQYCRKAAGPQFKSSYDRMMHITRLVVFQPDDVVEWLLSISTLQQAEREQVTLMSEQLAAGHLLLRLQTKLLQGIVGRILPKEAVPTAAPTDAA